jgi:hypothetical protein
MKIQDIQAIQLLLATPKKLQSFHIEVRDAMGSTLGFLLKKQS